MVRWLVKIGAIGFRGFWHCSLQYWERASWLRPSSFRLSPQLSGGFMVLQAHCWCIPVLAGTSRGWLKVAMKQVVASSENECKFPACPSPDSSVAFLFPKDGLRSLLMLSELRPWRSCPSYFCLTIISPWVDWGYSFLTCCLSGINSVVYTYYWFARL